MSKIAQLRRNYMLAGLTEHDAGHDPVHLFQKWLDEAVQASPEDWYEPTAMTVATVSGTGEPSGRILLLKGFDQRGAVFFTNYQSRKGHDLDVNPRASMIFHWQPLERQVRITGSITKTSEEESKAYFASRPRGSQLGAWASSQSSVVEGREGLEHRLARLELEYEGKEIPKPPHWGGYRLVPSSFEFWQGRPNRLHDRIHFAITAEGTWKKERLSP